MAPLGIGSAPMSRRAFLFFVLGFLASTSRAFLSIPYNTSQYFGPDGPWQAVSLGLKYPSDTAYSYVSVYPANIYKTVAALYVPTLQACKNDTSGNCASGGTVTPLTYTNGSSWDTYFDSDGVLLLLQWIHGLYGRSPSTGCCL